MADVINLPDNPTLRDLQQYIAAQCRRRGWEDRSDSERIMLLTEEVGEVAKEMRKHTGKFGYKTPDSNEELGKELVDVLNWVIDIANSKNIDMTKAFDAKWRETNDRTWDIA